MQQSYWSILQQMGNSRPELNILERHWLTYFKWFGNDILATGITSCLVHEFVYFGRCLPWWIIDQISYFRKYKIQPDTIYSAEEQWNCLKNVLISHFLVVVPQIFLFHPICTSVDMQFGVPFPKISQMIGQILIFLVLEDAWHYWMHNLMHHGKIYKYVHKIHHKHAAPFGIAAEYAHPIEVIFLGLGTLGPPILYSYIKPGTTHLITLYLWVTVRLVQAIDSHSGYDFPWSLHNFFPLWGGADHHDFHHLTSRDCYSSSFRWWDMMMGTDKKYKAWKARRKAQKKLAEKNQ